MSLFTALEDERNEPAQNFWKRMAFLAAGLGALLMVGMFFVGQRVGASGPEQQVKQLQTQVHDLTAVNAGLERKLADADAGIAKLASKITESDQKLKRRRPAAKVTVRKTARKSNRGR